VKTLSVVIPAFNEAENISPVLASIPSAKLADAGWSIEVIVVDNASTDDTGNMARQCGARVVFQPERGYGNAYKAGFEAATGDVIATGDADQTYPFDSLPDILAVLEERDVEFITTDRLHPANREAMKGSHFIGNHVLSLVSRLLFRHDFRDSQSGMWIFRREVWKGIDVRSPGMPFSQEIKNAAALAGYRVLELPIEYRMRGGEVKLNAIMDGLSNLYSLFEHRLRRSKPGAKPEAGRAVAETASGGVLEPDGGSVECTLMTATLN
jgi:glycosyltransferase involved in cell wall biosynthesis